MIKTYSPPHLIHFPRMGDSTIGFISVVEQTKQLPFQFERVYWTYYTPESIVRGRHAHHVTEQVLVALSGRIILTIEDLTGNIQTFVLDNPDSGVYIPPFIWHTMQYSHSSVQMVFASHAYHESDYIRDYSVFKNLKGHTDK